MNRKVDFFYFYVSEEKMGNGTENETDGVAAIEVRELVSF